jgi:hypothetical protein
MGESTIGVDKDTEQIETDVSAQAPPSLDALQSAFRDLVTVEVTKSVHQILLRQSEASRRMLETMVQAFLRDKEALETGLARSAEDGHREEVSSLVDRLATTAAAESVASFNRAAAEAQTRINDALGALKNQTEETERLAALALDLRGQIDALIEELKVERANTQAARLECEKAQSARTRAEAACEDAETARHRLTMTFEREMRGVRADLDVQRAEVGRVTQERECEMTARLRFTADLEAAERASSMAEAERDAVRSELETGLIRIAALHRAKADSEDARRALEGRLEIALETEATLRRQLAELAADGEQARHTPKALAGNDADIDFVSIQRMLDGLADPAESGEDDHQTRPGGQLAKLALVHTMRPETLNDLTEVAADAKVNTVLSEYAAHVLGEVESLYKADVRSGLQPAELVHRLAENLRQAQGVFTHRRASSGVDDSRLFDQALTSLLDARGDSTFGRHLAIASHEIAHKPSATSAQISAQAS